ncbi:unnamed protein product, partial [marine sediment metagenome]
DGALREAAGARQFSDEFQRTIHPFEPMIAASGDTAMQSVQKLMTTAAGLTIGNPAQKAQLAAGIIQQYGIDIEMLDSMLSGQQMDPQTQQNHGIQQMIQQELAPMRQFMGQIGQQRQEYQQNQNNQIGGEIESFAQDPKNEFFQDVREYMADMMEMAANRGEPMTIQQAYDKACLITPTVSGIQAQRNKATAAMTGNKRAAGKRRAASSLHGTPSGGAGGEQTNTLRGTIEDAWDDAT